MNTTNITILAALIAVAGKWAKKETLTPKLAVGTFVTAIGLSALSGVDAGLGQDFALLILLGSVMLNGPAVFTAIGRATS